MKIPKALERVVENFERLPGIGSKSAQRLGFYLLHVPQSDLEDFADALTNLKKNTKMCTICFNIGTTDICEICDDPAEQMQIVVVKSSNHFRADFQPHASHVIVAKAAGPMAADPADLPWQKLPAAMRRRP